MLSRETKYEVAFVAAFGLMAVGLIAVGLALVVGMAVLAGYRLWRKMRPRAIRKYRDFKWWFLKQRGWEIKDVNSK